MRRCSPQEFALSAVGKKFRLALFPQDSVNGELADWDGCINLLQRYFPDVWDDIATHIATIRTMKFVDIQVRS